ncbi:16S rRNA (guanine(527)-N(7))-methyltransferase RsmG [Kistimonas scapharcae]|uniref:Ribosomal RNA small subunit methyltransferase G n=1 Tax=Kistimonas scapharcae TaxID=1036133 RepID=A0ABP8V4Z7_9GAMM
MHGIEGLLAVGVDAMGLEASDQQLGQLAAYVELMAKWNQVYNLTAIRDKNAMVSRHILDSLTLVPHVSGENLLDVGSGPGLPGIPLAIMFPERQFSVLDCNGKKTRFMTQAKTALGLNNVTVENRRVEEWQVETGFDEITSRAFSSLEDMVTGTSHLLAEGGRWLAMKGIHPDEELAQLQAVRPDVQLVKSIQLSVPGCDGERHLVIIEVSGN